MSCYGVATFVLQPDFVQAKETSSHILLLPGRGDRVVSRGNIFATTVAVLIQVDSNRRHVCLTEDVWWVCVCVSRLKYATWVQYITDGWNCPQGFCRRLSYKTLVVWFASQDVPRSYAAEIGHIFPFVRIAFERSIARNLKNKNQRMRLGSRHLLLKSSSDGTNLGTLSCDVLMQGALLSQTSWFLRGSDPLRRVVPPCVL